MKTYCVKEFFNSSLNVCNVPRFYNLVSLSKFIVFSLRHFWSDNGTTITHWNSPYMAKNAKKTP